MKIHHLRNATFIIEHGNNFILVDPMLGDKGTSFPFSLIRYKAKRNPLVPLPPNSAQLLEKVTQCLITHTHPDHLDKAGVKFLNTNNIPVVCSYRDEHSLRKKGIDVRLALKPGIYQDYLNGRIIGIPATHGSGWIHYLMGKVMGFYLQLPESPSIYISADTILTDDIEKTLTELKPDIAIVASGSARLDIGQPILMTVDEIIRFVEKAPGKVIANHLESLNHCPTTRKQLAEKLSSRRLLDKVYIPEDGKTIEI